MNPLHLKENYYALILAIETKCSTDTALDKFKLKAPVPRYSVPRKRLVDYDLINTLYNEYKNYKKVVELTGYKYPTVYSVVHKV